MNIMWLVPSGSCLHVNGLMERSMPRTALSHVLVLASGILSFILAPSAHVLWLQALPAVLQGTVSKKMMLTTAQSPALSEDESGATARLSEAVRVRLLKLLSGPHAVN